MRSLNYKRLYIMYMKRVRNASNRFLSNFSSAAFIFVYVSHTTRTCYLKHIHSTCWTSTHTNLYSVHTTSVGGFKHTKRKQTLACLAKNINKQLKFEFIFKMMTTMQIKCGVLNYLKKFGKYSILHAKKRKNEIYIFKIEVAIYSVCNWLWWKIEFNSIGIWKKQTMKIFLLFLIANGKRLLIVIVFLYRYFL